MNQQPTRHDTGQEDEQEDFTTILPPFIVNVQDEEGGTLLLYSSASSSGFDPSYENRLSPDRGESSVQVLQGLGLTIVAREVDEQALSTDLLPLTCPGFDDRRGNSALLGTKHLPDLRLDTSEETVAQYQSFSPNVRDVTDVTDGCDTSAGGLFGGGMLASLYGTEAGSLFPLLLCIYMVNIASSSSF
jgi:hypothetical protein